MSRTRGSSSSSSSSSSAAAAPRGEPVTAAPKRGRPAGSKNVTPAAAAQTPAAVAPGEEDPYLSGRKSTRASDYKFVESTLNSEHTVRMWYESMTPALAKSTVTSYLTQFRKLVGWKQELAPSKTMLKFIKENLPAIYLKIKNMVLMLNTKKSMVGWFVHFIDHVPLLRDDAAFMQLEAVKDVRIYFTTLKIKSSQMTVDRNNDLYFPLESEVRDRIQTRLDLKERAFALIMLEYPARNDLNVLLTDVDPARMPKTKNWLYLPTDETTDFAQLQINDFKTKNFAHKYITNPTMTEATDMVIRQYVNKADIQPGKPVFFATKEAMSDFSKRIVEALGYGYISENFWRR